MPIMRIDSFARVNFSLTTRLTDLYKNGMNISCTKKGKIPPKIYGKMSIFSGGCLTGITTVDIFAFLF